MCRMSVLPVEATDQCLRLGYLEREKTREVHLESVHWTSSISTYTVYFRWSTQCKSSIDKLLRIFPSLWWH